MNKKLFFIILGYIILMLVISVVLVIRINSIRTEADLRRTEKFTELNEVMHYILENDNKNAEKKLDEIMLTDTLSSDKNSTVNDEYNKVYIYSVIIPIMVSIIGIIAMFFYIYISILKPFEKLKKYASGVANGDFDTSLKVERGNYFGDFTWAFDNMRKSIVSSRNAEKNAIENNKTVLATLSHDIKTPVASIRAYAEAFEANMDTSPEKRQKYLSIMMQKCDEVKKLTDDLFIHSISEMDRLEVKTEKININEFLDEKVRQLFVNEDDVDIILPESGKEICINADPKRLLQIFENLKSNADKYANTKVEISLETGEDVKIHFRDFGKGINEEELPFITGKFYRGKNTGENPGSGLGLYIVNELMKKMKGKVMLLGKKPGLDVVLIFELS